MHAYVYYMGYWLIQYGILAYTMEVWIDSARSMHTYIHHMGYWLIQYAQTCEKTFGISKYLDALSKLTIVPSIS